MAIETGKGLPAGKFLKKADNGFEEVAFPDYVAGRKVAIFGLPGAYTGTCSTLHLPSFIRTAAAFAEKGVDEIICISVNDPFVLTAWAEGAGAGAITMLADPDASFTKAAGMDFSAPPVGLIDRSKRYSLILDDGVVTHLFEDPPGTCNATSGEELLEALG